jgi:hypothetical protein
MWALFRVDNLELDASEPKHQAKQQQKQQSQQAKQSKEMKGKQ